MKHPCLFALVSSVLAACLTEAPALETQTQLGECPALICGNTPLLGAFPFWEVDETGQHDSANGFQIKYATMGGVSYEVDVEGFELRGRPTGGGEPVSLVGGTIMIVGQGGARTYELTINAGTDVHYFKDGDDGTVIPTYRISYAEVSGDDVRPPQNLCGSDSVSGPQRDMILFQGDRYDASSGELIATGTAAGPWFNLACKDDALWKLALFRHVEAASDANHITTVDQRMAALRSIRADYCGTGQPNTELGTAVGWTNVGGWLKSDYTSLEAVWNGTGAICVNEPRFIDRNDLPCSRPLCTTGAGDLLEKSYSVFTFVP